MSAIRGKNARSTERVLRLALMRAGITGWRLHANELKGNPDIYFPKEKIAIFVDGCFWHFCPKCGHIPSTRRTFWRAKIERNRARDRRVKAALEKLGIRTVRVWEHELKHNSGISRVIRKISTKLNFRGRAARIKTAS